MNKSSLQSFTVDERCQFQINQIKQIYIASWVASESEEPPTISSRSSASLSYCIVKSVVFYTRRTGTVGSSQAKERTTVTSGWRSALVSRIARRVGCVWKCQQDARVAAGFSTHCPRCTRDLGVVTDRQPTVADHVASVCDRFTLHYGH